MNQQWPLPTVWFSSGNCSSAVGAGGRTIARRFNYHHLRGTTFHKAYLLPQNLWQGASFFPFFLYFIFFFFFFFFFPSFFSFAY